jgi:hypothetical protein
MRQKDKSRFLVETKKGKVAVESNRIYGDYKVLHREYRLNDPHPPHGNKVDYDDGTAIVICIKKDAKGQFPDVVCNSFTSCQQRVRKTVQYKAPDGRMMKIDTHDYLPYYDFETLEVTEFAQKAGLAASPAPGGDKAKASERGTG